MNTIFEEIQLLIILEAYSAFISCKCLTKRINKLRIRVFVVDHSINIIDIIVMKTIN
jgi:hypothetical protein